MFNLTGDFLKIHIDIYQRWSRGHKARSQGQGQGHKKNPSPKPRTAFPRTDTLEAKGRNARGLGQGPRTQSASALQKKKKKGSSQKFFRRSQKKKKKKKVFTKIFQAISTKKRFPKNFSSSHRPIFEDLRPRGQGQGLQNVSSRTQFEVLGLGLGLEASSPRKLACPRLEDSTIFWNVKILWRA